MDATSTLRIANVFGRLQATLEAPDGTVTMFELAHLAPGMRITAEVTSFDSGLRPSPLCPASLFVEVEAPLRRAQGAVLDYRIPRADGMSPGSSIRAIRADWRRIWADAALACRLAKRARDRLDRESKKNGLLANDAARMASIHRRASNVCKSLLASRKGIETRVAGWRAKKTAETAGAGKKAGKRAPSAA